jgi:hypothetical protein
MDSDRRTRKITNPRPGRASDEHRKRLTRKVTQVLARRQWLGLRTVLLFLLALTALIALWMLLKGPVVE